VPQRALRAARKRPGTRRYEFVFARDQRVAAAFKRNGHLGNLINSVAKVVTRWIRRNP